MNEYMIDGIVGALFNEFGADIEIYTDIVNQGLKEPCFTVSPIIPELSHIRMNRYDFKCKYDINYFPKNTNPNKELNSVLRRLYDCLEIIKIDNRLCRGSAMNSQVADGTLHFYVNYNCIVFKDKSDDKSNDFMEELKQNFI